MGLSISQEIVRRLGSKIEVKSTEGKGSVFWFDLELPPTESNSESLILLPIIGYRGERKQILVVDDKIGDRTILVDFLSSLGFETLEASDRANFPASRKFPNRTITTTFSSNISEK